MSAVVLLHLTGLGANLETQAAAQAVFPPFPNPLNGDKGIDFGSETPTSGSSPRFWLIAADGSRRLIERFAVVDETLLVWPIEDQPSTTARSASARVDRGAMLPAEIAAGLLVRAVEMPLADCIAVLSPLSMSATESGPGARPFMETVNGERFPGEIVEQGDSVVWRHPWLGRRPFTVDALHRVLLHRDGTVPTPAAEDVVMLGNGDVLEGMVLELGETVIVERAAGALSGSPRTGDAAAVETPEARPGAGVESGATDVRVPLDRVMSVVLVTPMEAPTGPRLWFDDGTVVNGVIESTPTAKPGLVAFRRRAAKDSVASPPAAPGTPPAAGSDAASPVQDRTMESSPLVELSSVRAFMDAPERVIPLASIEPQQVQGTSRWPTFAVAPPTRVPGGWPAQVAPVIVSAATLVRFEVPMAGARLVGEVEPRDFDARWTSFDLIVRDGGREVVRLSFGGDAEGSAASATTLGQESGGRGRWLNVLLESTSLEIEVTEGARGPLCDDVRMNFALLIAPSTGPQAQRGSGPSN